MSVISDWSTTIGFFSMIIAKLLSLAPLDCLG